MTTIADTIIHDVERTTRTNWSPYLVGAGIGILSWIAFAVFGDPLGVTTAYSGVASLFAIPVIGADGVTENSYWKTMPLKWDYGVWFLVGIPLGAFVSAIRSGTWRLELVPDVWKERFGPSIMKRFVAAFFGGVVIMRRAACGRLHQRSRHLGRFATRAFELALPCRHVWHRSWTICAPLP